MILSYAEGTQVVLEDYFIACEVDCQVSRPGLGGRDAERLGKGASLEGNTILLYAHGETVAVMDMFEGSALLQSYLSEAGATTTNEQESQLQYPGVGDSSGVIICLSGYLPVLEHLH